MSSYEKYYTKSLYPFQDGILRIVKKSGTPFYLTGGTALNRAYYNQRYSDDLDFFLNGSDKFDEYSGLFFSMLEKSQLELGFSIDFTSVKKLRDYMQVFLRQKTHDEEVILKIDLINDVPAHFGEFTFDENLGKVDSLRNILSNKLSALTRYEAKDIADIRIIAKNQKIYWPEIFGEAKQKEAGLDPIMIVNILKSSSINVFESVKWSENADRETLMSDIGKIADDIFSGAENSLFKPLL